VVHLVRHGEVHNPDSIRYGQLAGFRLSSRGQSQARAAAAHLRSLRPAMIASSPLERAVETAEIIERELALGKLVTDRRLIESKTEFDGLPKLAVLWPQMWPRFRDPFTPSWGEPFTSIASRMRAAIDDVRAAHAGSSIVLVSHQAPIWVTRQSYTSIGPPWLSRMRCRHASITSLHFVDGRFDRSTYWAPSRLSMLFR
jgi:broad specificity phosphatase PhoE